MTPELPQKVKENFWVLMLLGIALIACLYVMGHTQDIINHCNAEWEAWVIKNDCVNQCIGFGNPKPTYNATTGWMHYEP